MKKVNELILTLLVLQLFIGTSRSSLRELTNCHGNPVLHYTSDEPMELCCQVNSTLCVEDPSLLTLTKAGGPRGTELDVGGNVTESSDPVVSIKLVIPSPKENEESGMYYCNCNGSRLKSGRVDVFALGPPMVHSITSTMDEVVTVTFNPGEPIPKFSGVYYKVVAHTGQEKVVMCEKIFKTSCQRLCTCQGKISKYKYPLVRRRNVTFVVFRHVSYHHSATTVNVNLLQNVIPYPVRAIQVEDVRHTSATLAICAIDMDAYFSVVMEMAAKSPLQMILSVIKTQGSYEKRKYTITFNKPDFKYCARVPLSQLTPFTKYDVKVTMSGGGGRSTPVYKSFTTHEAAPLSPPEGIVYWMVPETPSGSSNSYAINLNWQPIPHDKKGGPISYTVSYSFDNQKKANDSDVPRFTLRDIPDTPVTVDIYAKNKNGTSTSSSRVIIQKDSAQAAIELLQSHVEIAGDEADIYLQKPPSKIPITNIYWCPGTQNPQLPLEVVCKEYPKMVLRGTSLKNEKDMSHASVTLTKEKCQRENVLESIQETYNVYDGGSKKSSDERRNVTVVREFANEDSTCTSLSQSDVFKDSNQQLKFMFAVKDRPQLFPFRCYYNKNKSKRGSRNSAYFNQQLKFMFAVKDRPQLFPFRCYYNKNKTDVRLTFHQPVGKNLLDWRQDCDYNSPQQFFARKYSVYSSQDDNCIYTNQTLIEMENKIIPRSAIEISQTDGYVCVRASNSRLGVTRSYKLLSYGEGDQAAGTPPSVTVGIIFSIVLVITIIAVVCVYRKRAKKIGDDMGRFNTVKEEETKFVNHTCVFVESETCKHTDDSGLPSSSDYEHVERDKSVPSDDDKSGKGSDGNVSNLMFGDSVRDHGNDKGSKVLDGSSSLGTKHKPDSGMSSGLENSSGGSEMEANSGSYCSSGDSVMEANSGSHYSSGDSEMEANSGSLCSSGDSEIEAERHCSSGDSEVEASGGSHQSEALVSQPHCSGESEASIRLNLQSMIDRQKQQQMDQDSDSSDNGG